LTVCRYGDGKKKKKMTDRYRFTVEPYARRFGTPIVTHHGVWAVREGAIVTLTSPQGETSQGEIAPLRWFGTETLAAALEFCASFKGSIDRDQILNVPDRFPCCQFAFESALTQFKVPLTKGDLGGSSSIATLLPTGATAIQAAAIQANLSSHHTFKWKIGVTDLSTEQEWFRQLHAKLPSSSRLRLDANAGLTFSQAQQWLELCEQHPIEYLEQPLAITEFTAMQDLTRQYDTKIALDESIANIRSLIACYEAGWTGIYVIKPAINGSPAALARFLEKVAIDCVFSSVFETEVGYTAGLKLAQRLQGNDRAYGYGTKNWWKDYDSPLLRDNSSIS
jgi:o-succinylbenzoate synthase